VFEAKYTNYCKGRDNPYRLVQPIECITPCHIIFSKKECVFITLAS